jgi:hypothetical protein
MICGRIDWNPWLNDNLPKTHFSRLQWHDLAEFSGANDVIILPDGVQRILSEVDLAIRRRIGEMLPWRPSFSIITWFFQRPQARTRRISHTNEEIGHMEFLRVEIVIRKDEKIEKRKDLKWVEGVSVPNADESSPRYRRWSETSFLSIITYKTS